MSCLLYIKVTNLEEAGLIDEVADDSKTPVGYLQSPRICSVGRHVLSLSSPFIPHAWNGFVLDERMQPYSGRNSSSVIRGCLR